MIKNYIKKYEKYSIMISVLMVLLSLCLVLKPVQSMEIFIIFFSAILVVNGISCFISYFSSDKDERILSFDLINGLITILTGILVFIYRTSLIEIFPIILGIWIIFNNLFRLQLAINLSFIPNCNFLLLIFISILMIIIGILSIINPFASAIAITSLVGIFLLISELTNIFECIYVLSILKKIEKKVKEI